MIDYFTGEYEFLSNFYPATVKYKGRVYKTTEHAYQAAKTLDEEEQSKIANAPTPHKSKKLGRKVKLRPDWESVKLQVMEDVLRLKFKPGTPLADKLVATGDQELIEGNHWHDTFWGVCGGKGFNHLGKLLMKIRAELVAG